MSVQGGRRLVGVAVMAAAVLAGSGCWWQRDQYTQDMKQEMSVFAKRAELDKVLGPAFEAGGEFAIWFRPPLPTQLVQTPEGFVAWFQGGDPLLEVVLFGSAGPETFTDFQAAAATAMKAANKWPAQDPARQADPQVFQNFHSGETTFDLLHGAGQRQTQSGGAAGYQWLVYFGEDGPQKLMVCFIVPDDRYSDFSPGLVKCMESLALSSRIAIAQSGGGGASAGAASGASTGF